MRTRITKTRRHDGRTLVLCLAALLSLSCEDRPGSRSERDLQVGKASAAGLDIEVSDGLAVVRALDAEQLRLWASAPLFEVALRHDSEQPRTLSLVVDNMLPDATFLSSPGTNVQLLPSIEDDPPTTRRFSVTLPAHTQTTGEQARLTLTTGDADDSGPFRIALMSDIQEGVDGVTEVFTRINEQPDTRFILGAGDIAVSGSEEELLDVQEHMRALQIPYYTTLGNHDVAPGSPWHRTFGRGNFRFVFRGVQFSLIDSAAASIDDVAYQWLDGWLAEGRDRVHVVGMHIPPLDPVGTRNGSFGSRNEAGLLLASLAAGEVDLTVYGHIHSFYSFDNAGIPAIISGGGGARDEKLDGYGRHFVVIDLGADSGVTATTLVQVDP